MSSIEERAAGKNSSTDGTSGDSDSGSTSESSDEDGSKLVSPVLETPLQKPVSSTPQTNLASAENQKSNGSTKSIQPPDSEKPKLKSLRGSIKRESPEPTVCKRKTYRSLMHFPYEPINVIWDIDNGNTNIFDHILVHLDDEKRTYALTMLEAADESLKRRHRGIETIFAA